MMRILIVDDEDENCRLAGRMLAKLPNVQVTLTDSGPACLRQAKVNAFDVILLDICMPGQSGIEVCKELRRMDGYVNAKIIACTANVSGIELNDYLDTGFSGWLTKPFLMEELYECLGMSMQDVSDK